MARIFYPAKVEPVLTETQRPETVTESRWHQAFSEPVRIRALATAIVVASGCIYTPYIAPAETVTLDKYYQAFSEPQRARVGLATRFQQSVAYVGAAPFTESVTADRWVAPLAQPTYAKRKVQPEAVSYSGWVEIPQWFVALSEPQRARLGLPTREQQSLAYIGAAPFPEAITADRWAQPLSEPVRVRPRLATGSQQSTAYIGAAPFPETVSADRFAYPIAQPTRAKPKAQPDGLSYSYFVASSSEVVTSDKWYVPLSDPVRRKPWFVSDQQVVAFVAPLVIGGWQQPLGQPTRINGLPTSEQQSVAFVKAAPFDETVSIDRWQQPLAEPVRNRPSLSTAAQQATWLVKASPFTESVTADRWLSPLSEPQRKRPTVAVQHSVIQGTQFPDLALGWQQPTSQPTRATPKVQPDSATRSPFIVSSGEVVTPDKWYAALSEPVRFRLGLPANNQQVLAFVKAAPFGETVTADRWLQPLSAPQRVVWSRLTQIVSVVSIASDVSFDKWQTASLQPARLVRRPQSEVIAPATTAETVTLDKWFNAPPQPISRRGIFAALLQSAAFVKAAPFADDVTADRWLRPFSEPVRRRTQDQQLASVFVGLDSAKDADWFSPFSDPPPRRILLANEQQWLAFVKADPFPGVIGFIPSPPFGDHHGDLAPNYLDRHRQNAGHRTSPVSHDTDSDQGYLDRHRQNAGHRTSLVRNADGPHGFLRKRRIT